MKKVMKLLALAVLMLQVYGANAAAPKRVVAAGGGVTEIIYALGAEEVLVGVDTTSQYPAAAQKLPRVGYLRTLSAEGLLSLKPEVILATKEAGPAKVLDIVDQAGVSVQYLNSDYSIEGLLARIREIAKLLDKQEQAEQLLANILQQNQSLKYTIKQQQDSPKRILFLLTHGGRSPMSAGGSTAADALIKMAGGVNVVDSFHGYRPLSQEAVANLKPDYILTTEQGLRQIGGTDALLSRAGINLTPASQKQQLVAMDALYLLGFGPRVIQAAKELAEQLYPAIVAK